jgi:lysozyme
MNISAAGLNLIKEFEGFKPRPYRNFPGEPWTIGYGETQGVTSTTGPWSQDYAERKLRARVGRDFESAVERLGVRLNQHQFDALVSFVYNCGVGAIAASTGIGRALRARQWSRAADELMKWNKVNGEPVLGLTRRRRRERALFLKQVDPLEGYTASEKRWIREYDRLVRENRDRDRRRVLRRVMTAQRKRVWRAAQCSGGWDASHRRERYHSLLARTS